MRSRIITLCAVAVGLGSTLATPAHATATPRARFDVVNLVSDVRGKAATTDPKLVNPWGLAMGKTLWVSATGTGTATVYSGAGKKEQTEVGIPGGAPTGQVFNPTDGFTVKGKPATFLFSSPSGAISGWNAEADPKNAVIAAFTRGADYKGLALARTEDGDFLLAADFAGGRVHAWNSDFERVRLKRWQFRDPNVPSNYSPFNVAVAQNQIWVAYALRDPDTGKSVAGAGKGFVSRFNAEGRLTGRIARTGLNAPWAITAAPRGAYAGSVLVGNFGDGTIHAYRGNRHLGALRTANGATIQLPGLWDLELGTAANGGENALWFSAGVDGGRHGLLGLIRPAGSGGSSAAAPTATATPTPTSTSSQHSNHSSYGGY
ncbi:TIGR03118 family protein [Nonomuraea rhodomycinica]|uniref:TIGR03118 family protein n=1 Tax=Nonomuraea rhodomycinica TaxID=1712872 RepID=A0A7Y6IR85_9ACTN|nr:TIGR03118 family protein [Nonomuraea rhodomycinica]NUW42897.1 TIGR03118 family protein [Nonomuraea rhodomycinica]